MKPYREPRRYTARLTINLTPELLKDITTRARKERRNRSRFVRRVLEHYCTGQDIIDQRSKG